MVDGGWFKVSVDSPKKAKSYFLHLAPAVLCITRILIRWESEHSTKHTKAFFVFPRKCPTVQRPPE